MRNGTVTGYASIIILTVLVLVGTGTVSAGLLDCPISTTACTTQEITDLPKAIYRSPSSYITLGPSGYSDFGIVTQGPYPQEDPRIPGGFPPLHEMMSGELATAISYNGMMPQWTQECWEHPNWRANTPWMVETAPSFVNDLDADGFLEGSSSVVNADLRLTVTFRHESGTPRPAGDLSNAGYFFSEQGSVQSLVS